eukprot:scaffold427_cov130-Skeletonema_dohrnii-CCMP3373.AAC.4
MYAQCSGSGINPADKELIYLPHPQHFPRLSGTLRSSTNVSNLFQSFAFAPMQDKPPKKARWGSSKMRVIRIVAPIDVFHSSMKQTLKLKQSRERAFQVPLSRRSWVGGGAVVFSAEWPTAAATCSTGRLCMCSRFSPMKRDYISLYHGRLQPGKGQ